MTGVREPRFPRRNRPGAPDQRVHFRRAAGTAGTQHPDRVPHRRTRVDAPCGL